MSERSELKSIFSSFLRSKSFQRKSLQQSASFGDQAEVFESDFLKIRFVLDRGDELVDVSPNFQNPEWFDLALFYSLFSKTPYKKIGAMILKEFIENEFDWLSKKTTKVAWEGTKQSLKSILDARGV